MSDSRPADAPAPDGGGDPDRRRAGTKGWGKRDVLVLLLFVLAGLVVRLLVIDDQELWLDEAHTARMASLPTVGEMLGRLLADSHPPLYFLVLRGWAALFGTGEVALRWPSVLAGLALVPLVALVVGRFGGGPTARWLAAAVTVLSPLTVYYSVEARSYTLLWALGVGVLLALRRFLDARPGDSRSTSLWLAAGLTVLATQVHFFGVLLAPLWLTALWGAPAGWRGRVAVAGSVPVALLVPWVVMAGDRPAAATAWLTRAWEGPWDALLASLRCMALYPPFPEYLRALGNVTLHAPLAVAVGLWFGLPVVLGVVTLRESPGMSACRWLLPIAAFAPALVLVLVSLVRPVFLAGRYELLGYPAWIALWALGVERGIRLLTRRSGSREPVRGERPRSGRWLRAGAWGVTLLALAALLFVYAVVGPRPWPVREAARRVTAGPAAGAVVAEGLIRLPLEHQLHRLGDDRELLSFPPEVADHPGWLERATLGDAELRRQAAGLVPRLADRRVWVVAHLRPGGEEPLHPRVHAALMDALAEKGWRVAGRWTSGSVGVWLLDRP